MPSSQERRRIPGTSAFITPMLTIGSSRPVRPRVRSSNAPFAVSAVSDSRLVPANMRAASADTSGFTMKSLRFHSGLFMAYSYEWIYEFTGGQGTSVRGRTVCTGLMFLGLGRVDLRG
jgi:hypothetical protein